VGKARKAGVVLVAVLPGLLWAGPAVAKKGKPKQSGPTVTRVATSSASGNGQILSASPSCPARTRAAGGGFRVQPAPNLDVAPYVYESQLTGPVSWRASAVIGDTNPPSEAVTLTVYVYCRRRAPITTTEHASVPTSATELPVVGPTATADCLGRKVVAGGFSTDLPVVVRQHSFPPSISVIDSYRSSATAWSTRVMSRAPAGRLTTYAYCAARGRLPFAVSRPAGPPPGTVTNNQNVTSAVPCPKRLKGASAAVGGFAQDAVSSPPLAPQHFFIYESRRAGKKQRGGWVTSGISIFGNPTLLTSIAYCL
jgi:hypothetical protein